VFNAQNLKIAVDAVKCQLYVAYSLQWGRIIFLAFQKIIFIQ